MNAEVAPLVEVDRRRVGRENMQVDDLAVVLLSRRQVRQQVVQQQRRCTTHIVVSTTHTGVVVSGVRRMNKVNARRARLLPGWVTVFGWVHHLGV